MLKKHEIRACSGVSLRAIRIQSSYFHFVLRIFRPIQELQQDPKQIKPKTRVHAG